VLDASRWIALALSVAPFACAAVDTRDGGDGGGAAPVGPAPLGEPLPEGTTLDAVFARAAIDFDVPADVLKAIAWAETRAESVSGEEEFEGLAPAFGIMALRSPRLEEAASLAGVTAEEAKAGVEANVRAAAAWLSARAAEQGVTRAEPAAWAFVVAEYSGIEALEARIEYVHGEVYRALQDGVALEDFHISAQDVVAQYLSLDAQLAAGPDYAGSVWRPSPNYSSRPSGSSGKPQMVIIHSCEGSYSGCWGWLTNKSSGVSAHYVVNTDGTQISQLVTEQKKAWHISAKYKCSLNGSTSCGLNGASSNNFTIGIEHAGYAKQASWSSGLLGASAKLVCDITADQGIPRDQYHIVAHGKLQPYNRIDPGPNWPWSKYLGLVNAACDGGGAPEAPPPPPAEPPPADPASPLVVVVDTNNAANGQNAKFSASTSWTASTSVGGYYNTGYFWRSTGESSDLAEFRVALPATKKMVVEAWWTAAQDRASKAPFLVYDAQGSHLDTVHVNQQATGSQWVKLGTYALTAGWNKVALSRWTATGKVVVADAVRFTEAP
jgi:hypothetical protein